MTLQRIFNLSMLLLVFGSSLMAQGRHHHPRGGGLTDDIKTELNLSTEQVAQIDQMKAKTRQEMEDLHSNTDLSHEQLRLNREAIKARNKETLSEILSPEQSEQLKMIKRSKQQEHRAIWKAVDREAMHEEIQAYRKENIQPVIKVQREKLDVRLSSEEKATIDDIRSQLRLRKEEGREGIRKRSENHQKGEVAERSGKDKLRHKIKRHGHKVMKWLSENEEAHVALKMIADRHQNYIDQLFNEFSDEKTQWKADQRAIFEKYAPEKRPEHIGTAGQKREKSEYHAEKKAEKETLMFLLVPMNEEGKERLGNRENIQLRVYPNPAASSVDVTFELTEGGSVEFILTDEKGQVVKTIPAEEYEIGENNFQIDISGIQNGTYSLVAKGRKLAAAVQMVVVK